ncbi:similar to peptidylprolyl isomerase [Cyanidioschyzon merolae strain 10D]|jgi:hypothetical protein|uniref:Similar to peptidylprolyl isomerase n=1 Tax=Cyanidioschyzon merolae (strain NIES-3377 / 10D) TaxID=280699 RepID=M1VEU4_CYAM1|nr:similar to peptidylprolyl isomerase [Cyanidioschyzon merolae strain 10D]BAM79043.1 similar to peptidylprolyl isomerase [Cyanidioschyzon merolae strain 10D]|eukprot:XP_005535329.1 similar to peptidylprolyl isomerase [Cyanidioschyzon merolae strain 10D]
MEGPAAESATAREKLSFERRLSLSREAKERGNALVHEKSYNEAKRAYDEAFVYMFYSQEEYEYELTQTEKEIYQDFLLTLHLNRGLCKLKLRDFDGAKWDFDEAQRYAKARCVHGGVGHPKALYRRALTLMEMVRVELEKAARREYWDDDRTLQWCSASETDLRDALSLAPADRAIPLALQELSNLRMQIVELQKAQRARSKALFAKLGSRTMKPDSNARKSHTCPSTDSGTNASTQPVTNEECIQASLPALERVRIY